MEENLQRAHKLESIGILAGGIAHDFNNILTGIIGNLSLLKSYLEQNNTKDAYDRIAITEKATFSSTTAKQAQPAAFRWQQMAQRRINLLTKRPSQITAVM